MLQNVFESWNVSFGSYDFWSITKVERMWLIKLINFEEPLLLYQ